MAGGLVGECCVFLHGESMQADVRLGTIRGQLSEEQPAGQLFVNMASDGLYDSNVSQCLNFRLG